MYLISSLTLCCTSSFYSSVFEIEPKVGCYCLLTHRRGSHRNFLLSLLILKSKFWPNVAPRPRYATKGSQIIYFTLFLIGQYYNENGKL